MSVSVPRRRRDGTTVDQQGETTAQAQQAGQGPDAPAAATGIATAGAALVATHAAAQAAHAAGDVAKGAATTAAVNATAAGILAAFDRFYAARRAAQNAYVQQVLEHDAAELDAATRLDVASEEMSREQAFAAKSRARIARDLTGILETPDPDERRQALEALLARERRYMEQREQAMQTRTEGAVRQRVVEHQSPEGAYWKLDESARSHTPDCVAMSGKIWPHSVLRNYHPPLHGRCPCRLLTVSEAKQQGLVSDDARAQWASADQAVPAMQVTEALRAAAREDPLVEFLDALTGSLIQRHRSMDAPQPPAPVIETNDAPAAEPPTVEPIRDLDDAAVQLRPMRAEEFVPGARLLVDGEPCVIESVLGDGMFELDTGGAVRMTGATALGIPSGDTQDLQAAEPPTPDPEPDVTVTESPTGWEHERRDRRGKWFTDPAKAHEWAQNEFRSWKARLAPEHGHSLAVYKADDDEFPRYRQMNRALRGRDGWTRDALRHAPMVHQALSQHRLSEPVVVHRGVPASDLPGWPLDAGEPYVEHGFMSTSLVPSVPESAYSDRRGDSVQMHIHVPAGTPAGYLDEIGEPSDHREVLFPPGAHMQVDSSHVDDRGVRHLHLNLSHFVTPEDLHGADA